MLPSLLEVSSRWHSYHVYLGQSLLARTGALVREQPFARSAVRCAVVADRTVADFYAPAVLRSLESEGFDPALLTFPPGETAKSLSEAGRLAEGLASAGLDRHSFLVALGGGVTGDLAGFVASIYFRGIPYVQVPTTVVAQVDSSIGGKTGVNLSGGKNLLGAFHPPALVLADVDTLSTLPEREFNEGMAEAIKHAVIRDCSLLADLVALERHDTPALTAVIRRNLQIKAAIVTGDEFEHGDRALLNFGHTIGHGIEQAAGYGTFLHGEAVSLGMLAAARLSVRKAGLPAENCHEMVRALERFDLPTSLPPGFPVAGVLESMAKDKKFASGSIRFVLCPRLGEARISTPGEVTWDDLRRETEALLPTPDPR